MADDIEAFHAAALDLLAEPSAELSLENEAFEHAQLQTRLENFGEAKDALDIWRQLGMRDPERVPLLPVEEVAAHIRSVAKAAAGDRATAFPTGDGVVPHSLLDALFPDGHDVTRAGEALFGSGKIGGQEVAVMGTTDHAAVGVELALALAAFVLQTIREHPGRPLLLLVDTRGQRLSRRDELLGINGFLAHLAKSLEVARARGHRILSLIYAEAVSGGFLSFGLMADEVYALPTANVRVMALPAMARVTKQPLERLEELARSSPVFAPGVENYVRLGGVRSLWREDELAERLGEWLKREIHPADPEKNFPPLAREILHRVLEA